MKTILGALVALLLGVILAGVALVLCLPFGIIGYGVAALFAYVLVIRPALEFVFVTRRLPASAQIIVIEALALAIPLAAAAAFAGPAEVLSRDFQSLFLFYFLVGAGALCMRFEWARALSRCGQFARAAAGRLREVRAPSRRAEAQDEPVQIETLSKNCAPPDRVAGERTFGTIKALPGATTGKAKAPGFAVINATLGGLVGLFLCATVLTGGVALYLIPLSSKGTGFANIPLIMFAAACGVSGVLTAVCWVARRMIEGALIRRGRE